MIRLLPRIRYFLHGLASLIVYFQDELARCGRREWMDASWPEPVRGAMSRLWEELNAQSRATAQAEYALEQALDAGDVANIARAELDADFELFRRAAGEVIERS